MDKPIEVDLGTEAATRLQAALAEAKRAWFDLPAWVRRRLAPIAIVLDEDPAECGLRPVPDDDRCQ